MSSDPRSGAPSLEPEGPRAGASDADPARERDANPLESRIIRTACAYDAGVTAVRGSGNPDPGGRALDWLGGLGGAELDPVAVRARVATLTRVG
jgi:hypothetical protein